MPYREPDLGGYSLARLRGEALEACVWLTGELLRRDWSPPLDPLRALLEAAAAPEGFLDAVRAACEDWEDAPEKEAEVRTENAIQVLGELEEREDVYAFLHDLATAKLFTAAELDLLARLRRAWRLG